MNTLSRFSLGISILLHVPLVFGVDVTMFQQGQHDVHTPEQDYAMVVYYAPRLEEVVPVKKSVEKTEVVSHSRNVIDRITSVFQRSVQISTEEQPVVFERHEEQTVLPVSSQVKPVAEKKLRPMVENINLRDEKTKKVFLSYYSVIRDAIKIHTVYPYYAKQRGYEGVAYVSFVLQKDGSVREIVLLDSTGEESLDVAAMNSIRYATPFASFPANLLEEEIKLNVPISFELE